MLTLSFNLSDFRRTAVQIARFNRDQLPYALSKTINGALFDARKKVVEETLANAFTMRNKRFPSAAMRVEKASKRNLSGSLYDRLNHASLGLHASGGMKKPKSGRIAIPTARIKRTTRGVSKRIYKGEGGQLVKLYTFARREKIKKTFSFSQDFEATVRGSFDQNFAKNFRHALKTARR